MVTFSGKSEIAFALVAVMRTAEKACVDLADEDLVGVLNGIRLSRERLEKAERSAVLEARFAKASWSHIGEALGISKQAAQQKYGRKASMSVDETQAVLAGLE